MSGHSNWSSIKHKKGVADARRGKLFSKLSRALIVAAREGGGDPAANLALQKAIETVIYEGYAPGGVAILVEALTDNRNRTAADVRSIFTKSDGNLGEAGA